MPSVRRPAGADMAKSVYDPDEDGIIALAQLVTAVCSETEADGKITTHGEGAKHRWTAGKILLGTGAGSNPVAVNFASVTDFQANAATGTLSNVSRVNDGDVNNDFTGDAIGEYGEVDFGKNVLIRFWRWYKSARTGDGRWKIEYYDGAWHDWVTDIPQPTDYGWTSYALAPTVLCSKIRLTVTTVDTTTNFLRELEVLG